MAHISNTITAPIEAPGENSTPDEWFIWTRELVTQERQSEARSSDNSPTAEEVEPDEAITLERNILKNMRAAETARVAIDASNAALKAFNNSFVKVSFENNCTEFRPLDLLSFFWNNGPDTPCSECSQPFVVNGEPPIRTALLDLEIPNTGHPSTSIRIRNRHIHCLENANIKYIAVSHAWHPDIAVANGSGEFSSAAATRVVETLLKTVMATIETLVPEYHAVVEVWHDYFSVPQWLPSTKEALLLRLPRIFSSATACIVHLDNFSWDQLRNSIMRHKSQEILESCMKAFFKSKWFERMWVSLEYLVCETVHLMTSDYRIFLYEDGPVAGTFSELWGFFTDKQGHLLDSALVDTSSRWHAVRYQILRQTTLTYAQAISLIADKKCSYHRDRFLALCGFLKLGQSYTEISGYVPLGAADACRWVAMECLQRGDYSPLLLVPFSRSYQEATIPGFSWLVGHEKAIGLIGNDLGAAEFGAEEERIIRDNMVKPVLQAVGSITEVASGTGVSDGLSEFSRVVSCLLEWNNGCTGLFMSDIRRAYDLSLRDETTLSPEYDEKLHGLLRRVQNSDDDEDYLSELATLLSVNLETVARRLWKAGNSLCRVRCDACKQTSTFQLYLFPSNQNPVSLQVFRIPGLKYESSQRNGVGLVLSDHKIVGRMLYGIPACACDIRKEVALF